MNKMVSTRGNVPIRLGFFDRLARRLVVRQLDGLRRGQITLVDAGGTRAYGQAAELHATIDVHHPRFYRDAVVSGSISVGESYMRGDWDCDDLTSLFRIFVRNRDSANRLEGGLARLAGWGQRMHHGWRANTRAGSRRNIEAHYDLGNDFFRLWLDDTMAYSSGIFPRCDATLGEASTEKFDRVCRKLDLGPGDDVLEIGSGWGGFALHAAGHYGCRVTTTTISKEQFDVAQRRIHQAGLDERITLLNQDYRALAGQFDKLVSIEMIEAVGYRNFDAFFRQCGGLLRPDGTMMLQAIVMPERDYDKYLRSVDFLQRYIFPGGCLPSLGAILESVGRTTDLRFANAEDFGAHYAQTLRCWRHAFRQRLDEVRRQGFSPAFIRMWEYYLCYCEAAFEERHVGVLQIQFDKHLCRRDPYRLRAAAAQGDRSFSPIPATMPALPSMLCGE